VSEQATPNPDDDARFETLKLLVALCRRDAHGAGLEVLEEPAANVLRRSLSSACFKNNRKTVRTIVFAGCIQPAC
jgi:hypothetical protein